MASLTDFIDASGLNAGQEATLENILDELDAEFEAALEAVKGGDLGAISEFLEVLDSVEVEYLSETIRELGEQAEEILQEAFEEAVMDAAQGKGFLEMLVEALTDFFD